MNFISDYCIIRNSSIYSGGTPRYEGIDLGINEFLLSAYETLKLDYPKFFKMDNMSKLGILASECLMRDNVHVKSIAPERVSIVLSNAQGSSDTDFRYQKTTDTIPSPSIFVYTLPNIVAGEICIRHHFKGESIFFVFNEFNAQFLENYITTLFHSEHAQACIAGWVDVLEESYHVFLFLAEPVPRNMGIELSANNLLRMYQRNYGRAHS